MKIKVIDLFNKIANGEEVPKKLRYNFKTYFYDSETQDYCDWDNTYGLFSDYLENNYGLSNCLNDEIEILEEEKKIPEKLEDYYLDKKGECPIELTIYEQILRDKINDIIDYLKSKGE